MLALTNAAVQVGQAGFLSGATGCKLFTSIPEARAARLLNGRNLDFQDVAPSRTHLRGVNEVLCGAGWLGWLDTVCQAAATFMPAVFVPRVGAFGDCTQREIAGRKALPAGSLTT